MPCPPALSRRSAICACAVLLSLTLALPAPAYDSYLSEQAIREAYFLSSREGGLTPQFLAQYSYRVRELHQGTCTTEIRLETPFLQVADYLSKMPNYSSQDAIKDFYGKPMMLRFFLNICYMQEAPPPIRSKSRLSKTRNKLFPFPIRACFMPSP